MKGPSHQRNRRLKLSIGDVYLHSRKSKPNSIDPLPPSHAPPATNAATTSASDPFLAYKQSYRLPAFRPPNGSNPHTMDFKRRLRSLQSRPNRYKLPTGGGQKPRSKTIVADEIERQQRQLCSIEVEGNQSTVRNPLDPKYLTSFEQAEIKQYKEVYYTGHKAHLRKHQGQYRDKQHNYKPILGDHIAYRFEIVRVLGSGAFGKVLEVVDCKHRGRYALKILKASQELYAQFRLQIEILKKAKEHASSSKNIVQIKGDFQFRGHVVLQPQQQCIVTQMLGMNLYSYIKAQNYQGFQIDVVRKILIQLMQALFFLHNQGIIHCDIKPQNVVFKQMGKSGVKLIDFGSACYQKNKEFTYIQSRYYRSPEIVLMKPYDQQIDVWSLGCLIHQIYTGTPLFPARTQQEQMTMLVNTLGPPPPHFLKHCQRAHDFSFPPYPSQPKHSLSTRMQGAPPSLLRLMTRMLKWAPEDRPKMGECLLDEFILQGLPPQVREEHLRQMKSNNPYGLC